MARLACRVQTDRRQLSALERIVWRRSAATAMVMSEEYMCLTHF
jgi:hypothetical protein